MKDGDMDVLQAIRQRRSVRKFTDEPVRREDLAEVLEAGRWAPSGMNNQPCRFLVVMPGDERVEKLTACTKYAAVVRGAGALVAVFLDREAMYNEVKDHQAAGACIQNMLLAVHALGLGAVWLGEIINQAPQATEAMGRDPGALELMAVLAVGRPAAPGASSRRPLAELMLEEF
ncbi:nitroreductase family protein [Desulfocurvus sp. DL9XJH121]